MFRGKMQMAQLVALVDQADGLVAAGEAILVLVKELAVETQVKLALLLRKATI